MIYRNTEKKDINELVPYPFKIDESVNEKGRREAVITEQMIEEVARRLPSPMAKRLQEGEIVLSGEVYSDKNMYSFCFNRANGNYYRGGSAHLQNSWELAFSDFLKVMDSMKNGTIDEEREIAAVIAEVTKRRLKDLFN